MDLANQREKSLMQHIEDLTHRIEFKGVLEPSKQEDQNQSAMDTTINTNQTVRQNSSEVLATPEQTENKRIPVPEPVEPEQPKRGWLSRFFLPNG